MASSRAGLLSEGALYELISRGNKDVFFMDVSSGETAVSPFETRYTRRPGFVSELRQTVPLNAPGLGGRSCEFEFEIAGDLFMDTTLLIDLPTWIPPHIQEAASQSGAWTSAPGGETYGYTRGIAYFLFSKVQLYQDKLLLNEFSGDTLWASRLGRGSLNSAYLDMAVTGMNDVSGGPIELAKQTFPGRLRLSLPMLGGAKGVPSIGMRKQAFRVRLFLRDLADLIECSDESVVHPAPWLLPQMVLHAADGSTSTFQPLPRHEIAQPVLYLETRHVYLDPVSLETYRTARHEIPYSVFNENDFTFGGKDYATATPIYPRLLDAVHPASRLFWIFRSRDDLERGRRWATSGLGDNLYYTTVALIVASRDREQAFGPDVWRTLVHFAKEDRDPGFAISEMNWDLGVATDRHPPFERRPEGSLNFSTASNPALLVALQPPAAGQPFATRVVEMLTVVESWILYEIADDRGTMKFST